MKSLLTFLLICPTLLFSQTLTVSGIVKDSMNKPIEMASIYSSDGRFGTITNENGEFELKLEKLPQNLVVSHISFQTVKISVQEEASITIVLKESVKILPEIKVNDYAFMLVKNTIEKARIDTIEFYQGKGFYRRIANEGNKYTVLHEIFFDGEWNSKLGLYKWNPTQARYAQRESNFEMKAVHSIINGLSKADKSSLFIAENRFLNTEEYAKFYKFNIEQLINPDTPEEVAVVNVEPSKITSQDGFKGKMYIKTATNDFVRIIGKRNWKVNATSNFWFKIKDEYYSFDILFRENQGKNMLDAFDAELHYTLRFASSVDKPSAEKIKLMMYDYESVDKNELKLLSKTKEDEIFITSNFDPSFWKNNPVIKLTPLESSVINSFEKKGTTGNWSESNK